MKENFRSHGNCSVSAGVRLYQVTVKTGLTVFLTNVLTTHKGRVPKSTYINDDFVQNFVDEKLKLDFESIISQCFDGTLGGGAHFDGYIEDASLVYI